MRKYVLICLGGIAALAACLGAGCSSQRVKPCGVLPDTTACPIGRGGTCDDLTCTALYDCVDGSWLLAEICEGGGGAPGGFGGGAGGAGGEGACNGIVVDRTGEADGCAPPLQEPECPAAAAELCRPCSTGCVDFFLCTEDGWEAVAFCDEEGNVIPEP